MGWMDNGASQQMLWVNADNIGGGSGSVLLRMAPIQGLAQG